MATDNKNVKVTEEYAPDKNLIKQSIEYPPRKTKSEWVAWGAQILAAGAVIVAIAGLYLGYNQFKEQQQSENQKTFQEQQLTREQEKAAQLQALDQQQQTTLQNYVSTMSDLLLKENLRGSQPGDVVRQVAEAQTLTALQNLNPARKGILVKFLYDSGLIFNHSFPVNYGRQYAGAPHYDPGIEPPLIISLISADLSNADLSYANLDGADFVGADLHGANFSYADLRGAKLNCLPEDLGCTQLGANNFEGANLLGADLGAANLSDAINLTQDQLNQVWSCPAPPKGLTCQPNS